MASRLVRACGGVVRPLRPLALAPHRSYADDARRPPEAASVLTGIPEKHAGRTAVIFRPGRHAMQSGSQGTKQYKLAFPHEGRWTNPLMGWGSSGDPLGNVALYFDSEEDAVRFCNQQGFTYVLDGTKPRVVQHQSYSDNFKAVRPKVRTDDFW